METGGMDALIALFRGCDCGRHSYRTLAGHLNTQGYRNRLDKPFTDWSVEHVLGNRNHEGKAVCNPGEPHHGGTVKHEGA